MPPNTEGLTLLLEDLSVNPANAPARPTPNFLRVMNSTIESLLSVNLRALNIQGGWHHIVRRSKEQRAKTKSRGAKSRGQSAWSSGLPFSICHFAIFHFPFSIFHFPFSIFHFPFFIFHFSFFIFHFLFVIFYLGKRLG